MSVKVDFVLLPPQAGQGALTGDHWWKTGSGIYLTTRVGWLFQQRQFTHSPIHQFPNSSIHQDIDTITVIESV